MTAPSAHPSLTPLTHLTPAHAELARLRRSTRAWSAAMGTALVAVVFWAYRAPGPAPTPPAEVSPTPMAAVASGPAMLDESVFAAPICKALPKAETGAPVAPPQPLPKLQLLAIDAPPGQAPAALLYDQELDTTARVVSGATYREFEVVVGQGRVTLRTASRDDPGVTLWLEPPSVGGPR